MVMCLLACQAGATPGAACTRPSDCSSPLVCDFGRCRAQCRLNADCGPGAQCLLDHGVGSCTVGTDLGCESGVGRDCAEGLVCAADHCLRTCTTSDECPSDGVCASLGAQRVCVEIGADAGAPPADAGSTSGVITGLCTGGHVACAVRDGQILCWGSTHNGMLGHGDGACVDEGVAAPRAVVAEDTSGAPLDHVDAITCGDVFACAHTTDGSVYCWGEASSGEIGDGSAGTNCALLARHVRTDGTTPLVVSPLLSLSAADTHACALDGAQHLWCWGQANDVVPRSPPQTPDDPIPFATPQSGFVSATTVRVEVTTWGACSIAADHTFGCWGSNVGGRLGTNASATVFDAAGDRRNDPYVARTLVAFPGGPFDATSFHSTATCVLSSGALSCVGSDVNYELGVPSGTLSDCGARCSPTLVPVLAASHRYVRLATGGDAATTCGIDTSGHIECWGDNPNGNTGVASGQNVVALEATPSWVTDVGQQAITVGSHVAMGYTATCATDVTDTSVWCWGKGDEGILGPDVTVASEEHAHVIALP